MSLLRIYNKAKLDEFKTMEANEITKYLKKNIEIEEEDIEKEIENEQKYNEIMKNIKSRLTILYKNKNTSIKHLQDIFYIAINYGYYEIVELLLKNKKINPGDFFGDAIEEGRKNIIKLLLRTKNINPAMDDNQALDDAIDSDRYDIVNLLLLDERVINEIEKDIDNAKEQNKYDYIKKLYKIRTTNYIKQFPKIIKIINGMNKILIDSIYVDE
jgi:hypothetical protein